jgi:hypothetical protein
MRQNTFKRVLIYTLAGAAAIAAAVVVGMWLGKALVS